MLFLPVIITALGGFFLIKLRAFPLLHPRKTLSGMLRAVRASGGYPALALALAGTLGVGNIFGVAIAISLGGAGSALWLFISGVFASIIKYAEAATAVDLCAGGGRGGMMYAAHRTLRRGRFFGSAYAAVCIMLSLVMGAAMQSSAAVSAAEIALGDSGVIPLAFLLLSGLFILFGMDRIKTVTALLVPIAAVLYVLTAAVVIIRNAALLPEVIGEILSSAFTPPAIGGGALGALVTSPVVRGFATGILSNEAGAGTSSMAHASGTALTPGEAGLLGMCEVFFDTSVLCTLTALAILTSVSHPIGMSGAQLVATALFSAYPGSDIALTASIAAFALATVVCWYFYGRTALAYFTSHGRGAYLVSYLAAVMLGALVDCSPLAALSDVLLLLLSLITAPIIIKSSDRVRALSELEGLLDQSYSR